LSASEHKDVGFLSRSAVGFLELSPTADVYGYIADRLAEICPDTYIVVNSYDGETNAMTVRAIRGLGALAGGLMALLGRDPLGMTVELNETALRELKMGKIVRVPGGFHELAVGRFPKPLASAVETLLSISEIHAMGFVRRGVLFGDAIMLPKSGAGSAWRELAEAFLGQAAIALQHREAERALRESEEKFRELFNHAADAVFLHHVENDGMPGALIESNRAATELFGYLPEEFLAMPAVALLDGDSLPAETPRLLAAMQSTGTAAFEADFRTKDGVVFPADVRARSFHLHGNRVGLTVVRDISERKRAETALRESEARYRLLAEHATDIIWTTDMDLKLNYISPSVERLYGYTPAEYLEIPLDRQMTPASLERATSLFSEEVGRERDGRGDPQKVHFIEIEAHRKDGGTVWVEMSAAFLRNPDGTPRGVVGVSREITERRRLEERVRQAQKMEAVGTLAGGVAHDFNNLLAVVLSYAGMLLDEIPAGDPRREEVGEIKRAAERAAALTRQLLAYSRKQMMQPAVLDPKAAIASMEEALREVLGRDVALELVRGRGTGRITADPRQLEQAVLSIAANARDAMPDGGRLVIETKDVFLDETYAAGRPEVRPGPYVLFLFTDTGVGMDEKTRARLFEPYFTTKGLGRGTGLGLASVYGFVKQSGGHMDVYSEPGRGTTMKLYLPRMDLDAGAASGPPALEPLPRGTETVLVAEDEDSLRALVVRVLLRCGYEVLAARDGVEALKMCEERAGAIDILLTDIVMPAMDGTALAAACAARWPAMKVLYTSGYSDEAVVRNGIIDRSAAFMQKPFTPEIIATTVRDVLDGKK
jgi:PAS domain S-box-containing protein